MASSPLEAADAANAVQHRPPSEWRAAPVPAAAETLEEAGYEPQLAALLARRSVSEPAEAEVFLEPREQHLHPPGLLAGMSAAVARLLAAKERQETVAIVGDYDVDGVTGTALLVAVLRACGLKAQPILPDRLRDGYGFQLAQVERAQQSGATVILTVDCGTTATEAAQAALDRGLAVIVTDHHRPAAPLPSGTIQINPLQPGCHYPFKGLCGAGLALKLAMALSEAVGRSLVLAPLLRVACLGTIADLVPLVDENRVIAALGLAALGEAQSPGLGALLSAADLSAPIRADDVGFRLGPRLNAAGRLESPDGALELLLSRDPERARSLAAQLNELNRRRQELEQRVVEEALELLYQRHPWPQVLVAWSPEWHRGVVGIAAGRIAKRFHRPTLLLSVDGETATGSGRSIPGVSLYSFLAPWQDRMLRFGGHDAAVGLTVASDELERLRQGWEESAHWPEELLVKRFEYELDLEPGEVTVDRFVALRRLEPHGEGNPAPLVRVRRVRTVGPPRLFGKGHLSARFAGADGGRLWVVGWGWAERAQELYSEVDLLGFLDWDRWNGAPQLRLVDCRAAS